MGWNGESYGKYYVEQGEFNISEIMPLNNDYKFVSLQNLTISNLTIRKAVNYTVDLVFEKDPTTLPLDSKIFISFPQEYSLL